MLGCLCVGSKLTKLHAPYGNELELYKEMTELDNEFTNPLNKTTNFQISNSLIISNKNVMQNCNICTS